MLPEFTSKKPSAFLWQLPEVNPNFVCIDTDSFINVSRKKILDEIKNKMDQKNNDKAIDYVALTGLGGIGKTQLAIKYAYQHRDNYQLIVWIRANNNILRQFYDLLSAFEKKPLEKACHQNQVIDMFYQKLNTFKNYLLIFDDASEHHNLSFYLPKQKNIRRHILITSRSQHWETVVPLTVFTLEESIFFINHYLPGEKREDVIKLAEKLGYLPLALSHAIAYIKSTAIDIKNYLKAYLETPKDILNANMLLDLCETTNTISVYKTFNLSLESIQKKNTKAIELLSYCAYLKPTKISRELLKNIMGTEHALNQAIAVLRQYSLVEIGEDVTFFNFHCLIQDTMRFILKEKGLENKIILSWLTVLHKNYEYDREKASIFKEYLGFWEHVNSLLAHIEIKNMNYKPFVDLYLKVLSSFAMYQAFERHEYKYAQEKLFYVLALAQSRKISVVPEMRAKIYNAIGFAYYKQEGEGLDQGVKFFEKTLKLFKHEDNTYTAFAFHGLGCIYYKNNIYKKAIQYFKKSVSIINKTHQGNHLDFPLYLSSMAQCYFAEGDFEQAKQTCLKAIEMGNAISQDEYNFDVADAYYTLSIVHQAANNNVPTLESVQYFQKALHIFKKMHDQPQHTDILKIELQIAKAKEFLEKDARNSGGGAFIIEILGVGKIKLSPREVETLFFLTKGMSAKQTANILKLSQRTVEVYLEQIKKKMKCNTKLKLISSISNDSISKLEAYLSFLRKIT